MIILASALISAILDESESTPFFISAIGLYLIEASTVALRITFRSATRFSNETVCELESEEYSVWRIPRHGSSLTNGFYWVNGKAIPCCGPLDPFQDLIILPADTSKVGRAHRALRVEGPFGPQIGILCFMGRIYCYLTKCKYRSCAGQIGYERPYFFIVSSAAVHRIFAQWVELRLHSNAPCRLSKFYDRTGATTFQSLALSYGENLGVEEDKGRPSEVFILLKDSRDTMEIPKCESLEAIISAALANKQIENPIIAGQSLPSPYSLTDLNSRRRIH